MDSFKANADSSELTNTRVPPRIGPEDGVIFHACLLLSKAKNVFGDMLSTALLLTVTVTLPLSRLGAMHVTRLDEEKLARVSHVPNLQLSSCV